MSRPLQTGCIIFLWIALAAPEILTGESAEQPLLVEAWIKDGGKKQYATRILDHLPGLSGGRTVKTSRYGGRADRKPLEATGFFHTRKIGDRW